jgi:hypothetical protein
MCLRIRVKQRSVRIAVLIMIATLCSAGVGEAQVAGDPPAWFASIHADFTGLRYPPLPKQARITGIVRLKVSAGTSEVTVESGHQLLIPAAKANLEKWQFNPPLAAPIFFEYVFRLTEPDTITRSVQRGDALGRLFLRIFRQPTYRDEQECKSLGLTDITGPTIVDNAAPAVRILVTSQMACPVENWSYSVARAD